MPLINRCMPAATLGFGRTRNPEGGLILFIFPLMTDLSSPSCLPYIKKDLKLQIALQSPKTQKWIERYKDRERRELLGTIGPFESAFGLLGAPNWTLEWEAHPKENGRTTNLSIRSLISSKTQKFWCIVPCNVSKHSL